jgi:O-antigen ligase
MGRRKKVRPRPPQSRAPGLFVFAAAAAAILAAWLVFDPRSPDSFDDPKFLALQIGLAFAVAGVLWIRLSQGRIDLSLPRGLPRALLLLLLAGIGIGAAAVLTSSRRSQALESASLVLVLLLAIPVGASAPFAVHRRKLETIFIAGGLVNALLVVLAAARVYNPIIVYGSTSRAGLGALVGNAGFLALGLVLALLACLPRLLEGGLPRRIGAGLAAFLLLAGIVVTQSLSALAALGVGILAIGALRLSGKSRRRAAVAAALAAVAILAYRPVRQRLRLVTLAVRRGDWNLALTDRGAAWLAAQELVRAHPALGVGPGVFQLEFLPARLQAERRFHRRLVVPGASIESFSKVHNDYLEGAVAIGVPGALLLTSALWIEIIALLRKGRRSSAAAADGATLAAAGAAALTWFPFQIPIALLWILLTAGSGYRALAPSPEAPP